MNTEILSLAIALSLSCLALLSVLFSTQGKTLHLLGMGLLWLIVLLAAAAAWTAVAGRVQQEAVHRITGWYWWILPIYCGYVSYDNYTKKPVSEQQKTRIKLICALIACAFLIALVASLWPAAEAIERVEAGQQKIIKADSVLTDSLGKIDQRVMTAAHLDSLQTDSLIELHSQLLNTTGQLAADVASLKTQRLTPQTHANPDPSHVRPAAALSRRDRKKLRRAARLANRARRDSLRHAGPR